MKVLKKQGEYLEEQRKYNQNVAIILLIIGLVTIKFVFYWFGLILIGISIYLFSRSAHYSKGIKGELLITSSLKRLGKEYHLINDVRLPNSYGNIDHIVLGPNGIFIIETKNFEGEIRCEGDIWYQYKDTWKITGEQEIKSPSKQVKANALRLKQFIESQNIFKKSKRIWVEGIVVFANPNANLKLDNPTVPVLKTEKLCDYIKNKKMEIKFSDKELESIGKVILK